MIYCDRGTEIYAQKFRVSARKKSSASLALHHVTCERAVDEDIVSEEWGGRKNKQTNGNTQHNRNRMPFSTCSHFPPSTAGSVEESDSDEMRWLVGIAGGLGSVCKKCKGCFDKAQWALLKEKSYFFSGFVIFMVETTQVGLVRGKTNWHLKYEKKRLKK